MFDHNPKHRIIQRRQNLTEALLAAVSLIAGVSGAFHKGRMDSNLFFWSIVFILGVRGFWTGRHQDPWNPPEVDAMGFHSGALERGR